MRAACKAIAATASAVFLASVALAQERLEVIALRHRTADQVLPVLQPLLEPGAALSGQGNQLFVRTSPRNLADLRAALDAIDTPLRRLVVSVRFERAGDAERSGVEARTSPRSVGVGVTDERTSRDARVDQRIQVLEGGRAFIATGVSRPLTERSVVQSPRGAVVTETRAIQDVTTGFFVVPRIAGDAVTLEIAPQQAQPIGAGGAVAGLRASTVVRSRIGEWIALAGIQSEGERLEQGIASARMARGSETQGIWVKVEEVRP